MSTHSGTFLFRSPRGTASSWSISNSDGSFFSSSNAGSGLRPTALTVLFLFWGYLSHVHSFIHCVDLMSPKWAPPALTFLPSWTHKPKVAWTYPFVCLTDTSTSTCPERNGSHLPPAHSLTFLTTDHGTTTRNRGVVFKFPSLITHTFN